MFHFLGLNLKDKKIQKNLIKTRVYVAIFIIASLLIFLSSGCASQAKTYHCPNGHSIPMEKIKKEIRAINTCLTCGAVFPYLEEEKKSGVYSFGYRPCHLWPRVWVYRYRTTRFHSYQHHGH